MSNQKKLNPSLYIIRSKFLTVSYGFGDIAPEIRQVLLLYSDRLDRSEFLLPTVSTNYPNSLKIRKFLFQIQSHSSKMELSAYR
jgi:hypothetical protein